MRKTIILLVAVSFVLGGCASRAKLEPMTPLKNFQQFAESNRVELKNLRIAVGQTWEGIQELTQWAKRLEGNDKFIWFSLVTYAAQTDRNFKLLLSAMKRRGIKVDLGREAELLERETKRKQKNQKNQKKK